MIKSSKTLCKNMELELKINKSKNKTIYKDCTTINRL